MSYIYARDGKKIIATMYDEHRRDIPLSEVPQVMIDALVAAEDKAFFRHNGIDPQGILRAFVANTRAGETTQGASTITQQVVRMALTYFAKHPQDALDATEQTTARKLREARYAIALEKEWSKERILETYFNLSYFGQGAFGIFAASQVYYGKAPKDLELHEAAMLAALVKAPSDLDPSLEENVPLAKDRRDWVLDQMVETGAITAEEAAEAKEIDVKVEARRQPNDCVATSKNHWGFFCDFFYRWWLEQETFGSTRYERERRLKGGGFRIVTTLDVDIQDSAKKHVEEEPRNRRPARVDARRDRAWHREGARHGGQPAVRPGRPGETKNGPHTNPALRNQGVRGSYPNTTNPLIAGGGDVTGYQAGSTFKMFTIVAALEQGIPLAYTIDSPYRVTTDYPVEPGGPASCGNKWCPSNYAESVGGVHNMWTGMGRSVNTFFAQLIERAGAQNVVDVAERLGIKFRAEQDAQYAKNADSWERSPLASPPPRRSTSPTHTRRSPPKASTASRSRWRRSAPWTARSSTSPTRAASASSTRTSPGRRSTLAGASWESSHTTAAAREAPPRDPGHRRQADLGQDRDQRRFQDLLVRGVDPHPDRRRPARRPGLGADQPADAVRTRTGRGVPHPRRRDEGHRPGQLARAEEHQTRPRRPGRYSVGAVSLGQRRPGHPSRRRLQGESAGHTGRLVVPGWHGGWHEPQRPHHPRWARGDPDLQRIRRPAARSGR